MEANEQIPLAPGAHDPDFAKEAKEHQKAYKYMLEKGKFNKMLHALHLAILTNNAFYDVENQFIFD